jgi:hypothetical protein
VHIRYLYGAISDWNALFREAYRVTKPGGWIESFEASSVFQSDNDTVVPGTAMYEWGRVLIEAGKKSGRPFTVYEDDLQQKGLTAAGFVDLKVTEGKSPLSGWMTEPKWRNIGIYSQAAFEQDIEGE